MVAVSRTNYASQSETDTDIISTERLISTRPRLSCTGIWHLFLY